MADIFDVAKYILSKCGKMSVWKLQKLCYYSQAWHLVWTEAPLFCEDFQAWSNGPVCPELFHEHQGKFMIDEDGFGKGDISKITEDERESIDIVLESYGTREPYDLREQSHFELPWKNARSNLPESAKCKNIITKESMGEYYGSL